MLPQKTKRRFLIALAATGQNRKDFAHKIGITEGTLCNILAGRTSALRINRQMEVFANETLEKNQISVGCDASIC